MKAHCARATLLPKYFRRAAPSPLMADSVEKIRFPLTPKIALRGKEVLDDAANVPQRQCKRLGLRGARNTRCPTHS